MPLPRSWLSRPAPSGVEAQSIRDTALSGRLPSLGTQAHLRMLMATAGWDIEVLETANFALVRSRMFDILTETDTRAREPNLGALTTKLRQAGLKVDLVERDKKTSGLWVQTIWDSLTRHPWWVTSTQGQKTLVLLAQTQTAAEASTALFLRDLWVNLAEPPEHRLPTFRRVSLVSLMSPEAMNHYFTTKGSTTDVLVVHGGFLDDESMYQTFSTLAGVQSMFSGFMVYEAVVPQGASSDRLADVAKRSGFPLVLGVR